MDQDEAWFCLVVSRVARGRRLYAEVFYGAGPLPVWLVLALGRGRPPRLRMIRLLDVAVTVISTGALLLVLLVGAGERSTAWNVVAVLAAVALAGPVLPWRSENTYSGVARAAAVIAVLTLTLHPSGAPAPAALAGLSGGALAVATFSKHPLGLAAAVVVVPAWLVVGGEGLPPTAAGWALAGWAVVAGALLSSCALLLLRFRGELGGFVRRTLTDKAVYLVTGRLSFGGSAIALARDRTGAWRRNLSAYALVATGPLAVAVVAVRQAPTLGVVLALTAVSVAGVLPRADPEHVRPSASLAFVALLLALEPWPVAAGAVAGSLALAGAVALVADLRRPRPVAPVAVPRLDGLAAASPVTPAAMAEGRAIEERTGGRVLVLRGDAAQWYLALGLRNPTAYDYPLASTFGRHGQQDVADRLVRGDVEWCLFAPVDAGALTPNVLHDAVLARMEPVAETALGTLLRARPAPPISGRAAT